MLGIAVHALAVAAITLTITRGSIFAPLRSWLANKASDSEPWHKVYELSTCPYCMAHWVSFAVVLPSHGIIYSFAIIALASAMMGVIFYSIRIIGPAKEQPDND